MTLVLLSGSTSIAVLTGAFGFEDGHGDGSKTVWTIMLMLVPTTIGAINSVWNLTHGARDHDTLAKRFYAVARKIDIEGADEAKIEEWRVQILGVYADEPAVYHALSAQCYNAASKALEAKPKQLYQLSLSQRVFRNWWRFSDGQFDLVKQS